MHRRHFLLGLAGAGLFQISPSTWASTSLSGKSNRKMIVVMLRGAIDGLNVVLPHGDPNYYRLRPNIAVPRPGKEGGALELDGYFGLHPALIDLQAYWQTNRLAFVHAAGSPDPTRSHFDAQDFLETGTPGRKSTPDGWMNRLVRLLPGTAESTRAVSIGPAMPRILSGRANVANVASGDAAARAGMLDIPVVGNAFDRLYQPGDKFGDIYRQGQAAHRSVSASLQQEMQTANQGAPMPGKFPKEASKIATLFRKNPKMQFAFVALGGWDTHANQGASSGQLANHLTSLGQGLALLADQLGPLLEETVIVVMSEFGRTVRQNGNLGTDHGHGNVIWLLGGQVRGKKVYGDWQGLNDANLYEGRDLPVTTDFRLILAHLAERHLQLPDHELFHLFPGLPTQVGKIQLIRG